MHTMEINGNCTIEEELLMGCPQPDYSRNRAFAKRSGSQVCQTSISAHPQSR